MPNRFKFQGPNGSIIMEFDDNSTVFQARTLLSQTVDRKVKGLVAVADKLTNGSTNSCSSQSQHSVVRLADNQRMKDVDKRAVIMMDCEKAVVNYISKVPGSDQTSKQPHNTTESDVNMSIANGDTKTESAAIHLCETESKQIDLTKTQAADSSDKIVSNSSSISSFLSTAAIAMSGTSPITTSINSGPSSYSNQNEKVPLGVGLAPLPFNFSPFLLMPAVLKYCIHFEIDKFNINAEIFSHATMGCNAATMEKVLLLPAGEYMDGSGKFLPIVKHFMLQESERAKVYEGVKQQLKAAAAASVTNTLADNITHSAINNNNNQLNPMLKANETLTNSAIPQMNNNFLLQNSFGSLDNIFTMNKTHGPTMNTLNNLHLLNAAVQRDPLVASLQSAATTNNPIKALDITTLANATNTSSAQNVSPTSNGSNKSAQNSLSDLAKGGGPNILNQLNQHQQSSTVDSTSGSIKRMRRRTTISRSAKMVMLEWYLSNGRYLTADGRTLLSSHLGLTEENVRVFFKNLRRLEKKCEESGVSLYDAINRVDNESSALSEDINLLSQQSFNDDEEDSSPTMIKVETLE